jgi:hypothetical protein
MYIPYPLMGAIYGTAGFLLKSPRVCCVQFVLCSLNPILNRCQVLAASVDTKSIKGIIITQHRRHCPPCSWGLPL